MNKTPQDLEQDYLVDELRGCVYRRIWVWEDDWKDYGLFKPESAKYFAQAMNRMNDNGLNQPFEIRAETFEEYAARLSQDPKPPEEKK